MKRKLLVTLLLTSLMGITSCDKPMHESAIFVSFSAEYTIVSLSVKGVTQMIETKQTFPLLVYNSTCANCEIAHNYINRYRESHNFTFYQVELTTDSVNALNSKFSEVFSKDFVVPDMFIFDKGELTYTFTPSKMVNYSDFASEANRLLKRSNIINIQTDMFLTARVSDFNNYNTEFAIFVNDFVNNDAMNFYSETVFDLAANSKKPTIVVDIYDDGIAQALEGLGISGTDYHKFVTFEDGKIKEECNYISNSSSSISVIKNFYQ